MANRKYLPHEGTLENRVVELFAKITFGSSGAATLTSGKGIASVTKESADGQYSIKLSDTYSALLWAGVTLLDGTDENPASVGVHARLNSEQVSNATTPKIVVQFFAGDDGADANPADGAVAFVCIKLRNSSIS